MSLSGKESYSKYLSLNSKFFWSPRPIFGLQITGSAVSGHKENFWPPRAGSAVSGHEDHF